MKIFLSAPFTGKVTNIDGAILPEYRKFIEAILEDLRTDGGHEVFSALEEEDWRLTIKAPAIGVSKDLEEINNADILIAIVDEVPSNGTQFEIGYSVALSKRVILVKPAGQDVTFFNSGVIALDKMTLVQYDSLSNLLAQLTIAVNAPNDDLTS